MRLKATWNVLETSRAVAFFTEYGDQWDCQREEQTRRSSLRNHALTHALRPAIIVTDAFSVRLSFVAVLTQRNVTQRGAAARHDS